MCHAAATELLKDDLSPFQCPKNPEQQREGEAEVVCEWLHILHIYLNPFKGFMYQNLHQL